MRGGGYDEEMPIQHWSDDTWVVTLGNEPALSEDLIATLENASAADKMPHLVLDFSGVTQINSSNLSQLLRIRKLSIDRSSRLRVAGPTDPVWAVLIVTGLDKVMEFAPDTATALAGLQMKKP